MNMQPFPTEDALIIQPGTMSKTPTEGDVCGAVLDFVDDLRKEFAERDKLYSRVDDVIYLNQAVQIPENFRATAIEVRSPMPSQVANSITAALSINVPRISFEPLEIGDLGHDLAYYRKTFFEQAWKRQMLDKQRRLYRLFMFSAVTKGTAILKTQTRKNRAWAQYRSKAQEVLKGLDQQRDSGAIDQDTYTRVFDGETEAFKREQPYPIETSDIPPETFYYQMGENGFVRCAEVSNVPYYDTLKLFNGTFNGQGKIGSLDNSFDAMTSLPLPDYQWHKVYSGGVQKTIQKIELWDAQRCYVILRGPGDIPPAGAGFVGTGWLAKVYSHNLGDPMTGCLRGPYFMTQGITTASRKHEHSSLSVMFAYLHLFPLLNALLTMQSQAAFTFSYPAYKRTTPPTFGMSDTPFGMDAKDIHENRRVITPGAIFGHDIAPMDQPRSGVDLDKAIQFVTMMLERMLPDSVQGVITGETAGYALNQATHLATLAWSPILDNAKTTLSQRVGHESYLIERSIGETVYTRGALPRPRSRAGYSGSTKGPIIYKDGWIGIGPKQLGGYHDYEVELDPVNINNDSLTLRNLKDELDMRLIDPAEAIRRRGRNPVDVERAWMIYEIKQDKTIRDLMKQRIFRNLATIDQQTMLGVPDGSEPQGPPLPLSGTAAGAQPGVSQGLPTTGFVPPSGAGAPPASGPPLHVPPAGGIQTPPGIPGTPAGAPGGIPGAPALHSPIPGG